MKESLTLKDQIYERIMDDILSHQYGDQDVINEKDLVEKYGCSKTPVREALISLCNDNVLRSIPRYGYEVIRLTMDDVKDMIQYRFAVEGGVLASNMHRFGKNQINQLKEIDAECTAAEGVWEHWALNTRFHKMMLVFAGNTYAADNIETCMNNLKRAYAQFCWNNVEPMPLADDTKFHKEILSALQKQDENALLDCLKSDLNDFAGGNMGTVFIP